MNFDRTQQELLAYCKENKFWRIFIPIAELLLIGTSAVLLLDNFLNFGGAVTSLLGILRFIAIVMVLAKANYKVLTVGLGINTVDKALSLLLSFFKGGRFVLPASTLIWGITYALLTLAAFKKSGMSVDELKRTVTTKDGLKKTVNLDEAKQFDAKAAMNTAKEGFNSTVKQVKDIKREVDANKAFEDIQDENIEL